MNVVSIAELKRSLEEWKRLLEEDSNKDEDLVYLPVAEIEYKSVVTGGLKSHLDFLRNRR
jgi:hypothetical protein